MTTLLIDADIVAYSHSAAGQRTYQWDDEGDPSVALDDLDKITIEVDEWLSRQAAKLKAKAIVICLSCPTSENWRKAILPSYKENRNGVVKPSWLGPVKDYLEAKYPSYRKPTLEADDIMGILSTMPGLPRKLVEQGIDPKDKKVIVSIDKDMKTVPGWLYDWKKSDRPRFIDEVAADGWHMQQALMGDSTDGYRGCPGIGPVNARNIVEVGQRAGRTVWGEVVATFKRKGLTEADALVQAQVARICRASDYDFKKGEVIPWTPSSSS